MGYKCQHLGFCHGCHFDGTDYPGQLQVKKKALLQTLGAGKFSLPEIQLKSCGENFLRTRFDFTISENCLGLYGADRKLIDLNECQQLKPALQQAFLDFKKVAFPIKKGSVRLRIGPSGIRGVWLDFANLDIKDLLAQRTCFDHLFALQFFVEIGQKGKALVHVDGEYKLSDPQPKIWFQSDGVPLLSLVSSFTQPSWITADAIFDCVRSWIPKNSQTICEFGSGIGQFTLPLLAAGHKVDVFEVDKLATELTKKNAQVNNVDRNLQIYHGDFHHLKVLEKKHYDTVLVNPARSGLRNFSNELILLKPKSIIYISCFPESLGLDVNEFVEAGYSIKEIFIVDQFPQTQHFETCLLLERVDLNA